MSYWAMKSLPSRKKEQRLINFLIIINQIIILLLLINYNYHNFPGHIVMDMCCFDDGNVVLGYEIATLQKEGTEAYLGNLPFPKIRRMVIPLNLEGVVSS